MIVVSDTSPISYLVSIGEIEILPALFPEITIPQAVRVELSHPLAPPALRSWIARPPDWLEILAVPPEIVLDLGTLHLGEREAIQLAAHLNADLLILDDKRAREAASRRGLPVTGLLGILDRAAARGLIAMPDALEKLQRTSFRADPRILKLLLDRNSTGS